MPVRILHAHSTFSLGGKEARAVRLMNAFGDAAAHVVLSGTGALGARAAIEPGISVALPSDATPLVGKPGPLRYLRLARFMRRFDLVLTYNWGAMDVVAARRLFGGPPLIHHEDGFNEDEATERKLVRNRFRRLMLPAARKVVVPSKLLQGIALDEWRQPAGRIKHIPNGIAVGLYAEPPSQEIPGLTTAPGALVVGTVAGLRPVKNLPRLVRAFAATAPSDARLVIVGEGPDRARIEATAQDVGVADRLVLPGFMSDPARWIGHFDVFALSSDSEQFPIAVAEAMAAGLPVVATDVGDVRAMLSDLNLATSATGTSFRQRLQPFMRDPLLRDRVGAANRAKALAEFDERAMIARYAALYGAAIGRPDAFGPARQ